jgi:hypothetical protein
MEGILAGLVNLGLGGVMGAALIWFLHHLVTKTLPEMTRTFREEVSAEREQRRKEHQALLEVIDRLGRQQHKEHEAILDRLDFGFKEMVNEIADNRAARERRLEGSPSSPPGATPGHRKPRQP